MESGMQSEHLVAWSLEQRDNGFRRGGRHHQAMPLQSAVKHCLKNIASAKRESIQFIHHKQIKIMGIAKKLMGRKNQTIPFKDRVMPAVNRHDSVFGERGSQALMKLDDNVPTRQSKANAHATFHGIGKHPIANLCLSRAADRINQSVYAMHEIGNNPFR